MMKFPTEWKNKIHVPNQQPAIVVWINSTGPLSEGKSMDGFKETKQWLSCCQSNFPKQAIGERFVDWNQLDLIYKD